MMASPSKIKQESCKIKQESCDEDVKSSNTSLNSSANLAMKNCMDINQSATHDEKYRNANGDAGKRNFPKIKEEKNKEDIDLNFQLFMLGFHLSNITSSNQCSKTSSATIATPSRMPLNNQDSSSEEVEFSNTTLNEPELVVMGCPNCIIYVMVSEIDPKCPQCKSSVLIDMFRN